jgi:hypothetical protein
MQGGNATTEVKWQTGVANLFRTSGYPSGAICLQETGPAPSSAMLRVNVPFADPFGAPTEINVYDWSGATRNGRTLFTGTIIYHGWDTLGHRVNTAVVTRRTLPHPANVALIWGNAGPTWRPAVGVQINGDWLFSYHAISRAGGPDAPFVLAAIAGFAGANVWRVGGDFNREPPTLAGGLLPAGSVVCRPHKPTHPTRRARRRYDYFVNHAAPRSLGAVLALRMSDHLPVAYLF